MKVNKLKLINKNVYRHIKMTKIHIKITKPFIKIHVKNRSLKNQINDSKITLCLTGMLIVGSRHFLWCL